MKAKEILILMLIKETTILHMMSMLNLRFIPIINHIAKLKILMPSNMEMITTHIPLAPMQPNNPIKSNNNPEKPHTHGTNLRIKFIIENNNIKRYLMKKNL